MRPLLTLVLYLPVAAAFATTPDLLLEDAAAHYAEVGREQALADFTTDPRFREGALYVFCVDGEKRLSASGGFPKMVGVAIDRYTVGGRSGLASFMNRVADAPDAEGDIAYQWVNPSSGKIEDKRVHFRRFGEDVCGVGQYVSTSSGPPKRNR